MPQHSAPHNPIPSISNLKQKLQFDNGHPSIRPSNLVVKVAEPPITIFQLKKYSFNYLSGWVIFQMIMAIDVLHSQVNIYHGNVRTSNFLSTTYEYLILTDIANYKPTYILEDTEQGLAEFRLFYSTSLEKCNLAPEKLQGRNESANKIKRPEYLFSLYKES